MTKTERVKAIERELFLGYVDSPCVKIHEHCYGFISRLASSKEEPEFVGRVVSSLMVGVKDTNARIPDPWGFSPDVLRIACHELSLPGLIGLPGELLVRIQKHSSEAPVWCFARAVALKRELSLMPYGTDMGQFLLSVVESWSRGDRTPQLKKRFKKYMRVTLDHHGISKVEALDDHPEPLSESRSGSKRFIVTDRDRINDLDTKIYFKVV